MKLKKTLGFTFLILSIGFTIPNIKITGAIIGSSTSSFLGILAMVFLFVGSTLLINREKKEVLRTIDKLVQGGTSLGKIENIQDSIRKNCKHLSKNERKEVYNEIAEVMEEINSGKRNGGKYNLHILKYHPTQLSGISKEDTILEADAKIFNKYTGSKRRGANRYVFDSKTGEILGVGYEPSTGSSTNNLKWLIKF
jgi:hypothetical protein